MDGQEYIEITGARVHNLRDISLRIPRHKLVVITGISGSGKSSLAFDTIYAEGQRRYLESFSAYARQFIGDLERPDVESISGLTPVVSIEQKSTSNNPRSTVGTVTEIYDFLRLLYARASLAYSYKTGKPMVKFTDTEIIQNVINKFDGKKILVLAPLVKGRKGHYRELFEQMRKQGYLKMRVDGELVEIAQGMMLDRYKVHDIELVVDRIKVNADDVDRLRQSVYTAMRMASNQLAIVDHETNEYFQYSLNLMCPDTGISYEEPSPNSFSFNSPYGACPHCKGLGVVQETPLELLIPDAKKSITKGGIAPLGEMRDSGLFRELKQIAKKRNISLVDPIESIPQEKLNLILFGDGNTDDWDDDDNFSENDDRWYTIKNGGVSGMLKRCFKTTGSEQVRQWAEAFLQVVTCNECNGYRLKKEAYWFKLKEKHIGQLAEMDVSELEAWFADIEDSFSEKQKLIAADVLKEIRSRIGFLLNVGLDYLQLNRPARTLSGGEAQRIRLATQIGSKLSGITYILDEPSIGLHQRDNQQLIFALKELVKLNNTVLVVEHDQDIMLQSDYIFDLGPAAGKHGGKIMAEGAPSDFIKADTLTAQHLAGKINIQVPAKRRKGNGKTLKLTGASGNNLKEVNADFPLGKMICVTGVSGSGKSTLIIDTLYPILKTHFYRSFAKALPYKSIKGLEHLDKVVEIDQQPIGRTPRSNPATYVKVFDDIRRLFAELPEAKIRAYKPGRFSFNVKGGRCEECRGGGMKVIEMGFLPDVMVECPSCFGKRYNRETLDVRYKGKSINDVLNMTIEEATKFFEAVPSIYRRLKTLKQVGLGYLTLGQSSTSISGGEAQRVKLATELSKKDTGNTFYILDEPTTGLHFEDIKVLLKVLDKLVERGNTVLIIEHNMDVIKVCDYVIDIGPDGGKGGGTIVATGTPEELANNKKSITAKFIKEALKVKN